MSVQVAKRWFTVAEYYRMAEAGIFSADDRVELIRGEVMEMSPIGSRHAACVRRLDAILNRKLRSVAQVSLQNPIRLDDYSEPEPDIALLKPRDDFYAEGHPSPADVLLVIEVADSSVEYDREVKVPLYAAAGISQVWLVNLPDDTVESYAQPLDGTYREIKRMKRGESIQSQTIPNLKLKVVAILG